MGKNKNIEHIEHEMNEIMPKTAPPAIQDAKEYLDIKPNQIFISDDAYIGNPYSLLGQVIIIRKENGNCPGRVITNIPEYALYPVKRTIDPDSTIKDPLLVRSFIVDKELSAGIDVLSYLSANLDSKSAFSVLVYNQAIGLVDEQTDSWRQSLNDWKKENMALWKDENICYLLLITGIVQKNIIRKKYYKLEGGMNGGAFGINLKGNAYTSSEEYAMDVRFGLTVKLFKHPQTTYKSIEPTTTEIISEPSNVELELFKTITQMKNKTWN